MQVLAPVRHADPVVDRQTGRLSAMWQNWLSTVRRLLNLAVKTEQTVRKTDQAAAIATTAVPLNQVPAGLYRLSWMLRIARAATTSSEVQATLRWVDDGVTLTKQGVLVNGNTTASYDSGSVLIRVDKDSQVDYAVSYTSVGATPALFDLDVVLEGVPT